MKPTIEWPAGATVIEIGFGRHISISSGEGTWSPKDEWTVWDSSKHTQGARMVEDKLTYEDAVAMAQKMSHEMAVRRG